MYIKVFFAVLLINTVVCTQYCHSQSDPEFSKGFIMHLAFHNGMVTHFTPAPDRYVAGLRLEPRVTVVAHVMRVGLTGDGFYLDKTFQASLGPSMSLKLKTFNAGIFGSVGNINLLFEHLWGTSHQRLAGGGVVADAGNLVTIALTAHRDYFLNNWWFQNVIGIRISKKKKVSEPFNQ